MLGETLIVSEEVNEKCEESLCRFYDLKHRSVSICSVLKRWK